MAGMSVKNNPTMQNAVIEAVRDTGNITKAAEITGVGRSTIYRIMDSDPQFTDKVTQARLDYIKGMTEDFQQHAPEAVNTLLAVIRDPHAPATAKVNASRLIIDYSMTWGEALDMDTQIKQLQDSIAQAEKGLA